MSSTIFNPSVSSTDFEKAIHIVMTHRIGYLYLSSIQQQNMKIGLNTIRRIVAALCTIIGVSLMAASWMLLMAGELEKNVLVEEMMGVVVAMGGYLLWTAAGELEKAKMP
jgi:hypothetical protein